MKWALPALLTLVIGCGGSDTDPNNPSVPDEAPGTPNQEQLPNSSGTNVATSGLSNGTWVKCVDHRSHKLPNHNKPNRSTIPYSKLKYKIFGRDRSYTRVDYYFYNSGCTGEIYAKRQYFGTWSFPGTTSMVNLNGSPTQAQDIDLKITGYWRTYFQTSKGNEALSYDNSHCRLRDWVAGVPRDMMTSHCARNYGPNNTTFEIVHVSSNPSEGMYFGHTTRAHNGHSVGNRPVEFGSHYVDSMMFTGTPAPPTFPMDIRRPQ